MSAYADINKLHSKASRILRPRDRSPTRAEYGEALELADEAMDIAVSAGLDNAALETCAEYQRFCMDPLMHTYSRTESHERYVYDRSSKKRSLKKRRGRLFDVDKGEHLVEAIGAVHFGDVLGAQEPAETRDSNRTIRFADEVEGKYT